MLRYKLSTVKRRSGTAQSTAVGGHMMDISNCSTVNGSCGSHYNGRDVVALHTVVGIHPLCAIMADIHGYTHLALGRKNGCYTRLELTTAGLQPLLLDKAIRMGQHLRSASDALSTACCAPSNNIAQRANSSVMTRSQTSFSGLHQCETPLPITRVFRLFPCTGIENFRLSNVVRSH